MDRWMNKWIDEWMTRCIMYERIDGINGKINR